MSIWNFSSRTGAALSTSVPAIAGARARWAGPINRRVLAVGAATFVALAMATFGGAEPADASLAGVTLVTTPSDPDSDDKEVQAECPPNTVLYGGGGRIVDGGGQVLVSAIIPDPDLLNVTVRGEEDGDYLGDWRVVAMAVCAPEGNHNLTLEATQSVVNGTSISPRSNYALCDGQTLFSSGFELSHTDGNVFIAEMEPSAALDRVEVQAVEDFTYNPNWDLTTYAICGDPDTSTVTLTAPVISGLNSSTNKTVEPQCDPGFTTIGIGGMVHDAAGDGFTNAVLDRFSYTLGLSKVSTIGRENGTTLDDWQLIGYAICLS